MTGFENLLVIFFVPLLCGAQPEVTNTNVANNSTPTCSPGVCSVGKWALYLGSKTKEACKATCEEGRKLVPVPDGVQEDMYSFRQDGAFHMVAGGKRAPNHEKTVTKIDYPGTGNYWSGWSRRDHYYAHWEGKLQITKPGKYTFFTSSDDGSRMFVNDNEVVANPGWHGMRLKSGQADMTTGVHTFWAEMFEGGGGAGMQVFYQGPDTDNSRVIIPAAAYPEGISEKGYYFRQNGRFHDVAKVVPAKTPTQSRIVPNVNYAGTHGYWSGFKVRDHYYVRWSGYINIKVAGKYTFYTTSDDGSRLNIDDKDVVSNPGWHGMREKNGAVDNMAVGKHKFWAEMFEGGSGAGMIMYYNGPDTGNQKVVVPQSAFSTTLEGSGKMELNRDWQAVGQCAAFSHSGSHCVIYSKCETVSTDAAADVCEDKAFNWVGEASTFTTCKYEATATPVGSPEELPDLM